LKRKMPVYFKIDYLLQLEYYEIVKRQQGV